MSTFQTRKLKPTSWKASLRQKSDGVNLSNIKQSPVQINWKASLRQKIEGSPNISTHSPAHNAYLRAEYLKKGHLTNAHKKYINTISSQRVVTKGCSGC